MKLASVLLLALATQSVWAASDPTAVPDIIDADAINPAVNPCDNFYQYACGAWLDKLTLPADKSSYYHQFTALEDQSLAQLRDILAAQPKDSKLAKYYASCMDTSSAAAQSALTQVAAQYARIDAIKDRAELARVVAALHLVGVNVLFSYSSGQDLNNAAQVIGFAGEGGMGLPERDYYIKDDAKSAETRARYVAHVAKILVLTGAAVDLNAAQTAAADILAFEKNLAEHSLSLEDQGDPSKINHPVGFSGLKGFAPGFDWDTYFAALGGDTAAPLTVTEPDFFQNLNNELGQLTEAQLKTYLKWQVALRAAPLMGQAIADETWSFWQGYLRGAKAPAERWKKCTSLVGAGMGDELGKAYVATIKDAKETKTRTQAIIETIKSVFSGNLDSLTWLDQPTVAAAREKLARVNDKVAFPDQWKDYSSLEIGDALVANDLNASAFEAKRALAKIGKPVDRAAWQMAAWEANAYYDPSLNEIVFPYGELVNPIFSLSASDGANMGALGATVGHELTHGFDNDGSKYDGFGNVKNWWPDAIRAKFEERAQCLIDQANHYEVLPGMFVNGSRTLTENIADQGGTKLAYLAYKRMAAMRPPAPPVAGFNEEQQYFVSYAQSWCAKRTPESMRLQLISNVHPPEEFRVNGVLMNIPAFADAFGCKVGTKMAPTNRCSVW